jgi:hypothetical protein
MSVEKRPWGPEVRVVIKSQWTYVLQRKSHPRDVDKAIYDR